MLCQIKISVFWNTIFNQKRNSDIKFFFSFKKWKLKFDQNVFDLTKLSRLKPLQIITSNEKDEKKKNKFKINNFYLVT